MKSCRSAMERPGISRRPWLSRKTSLRVFPCIPEMNPTDQIRRALRTRGFRNEVFPARKRWLTASLRQSTTLPIKRSPVSPDATGYAEYGIGICISHDTRFSCRKQDTDASPASGRDDRSGMLQTPCSVKEPGRCMTDRVYGARHAFSASRISAVSPPSVHRWTSAFPLVSPARRYTVRVPSRVMRNPSL